LRPGRPGRNHDDAELPPGGWKGDMTGVLALLRLT